MSTAPWPPEFSAEHAHIRVEPLALQHLDDLRAAH